MRRRQHPRNLQPGPFLIELVIRAFFRPPPFEGGGA